MTPQSFRMQMRELSGPFRALCVLLAAAFLLGGSARGDVQSLILLRPLAILLLFYGLARLDRAHIGANRFVLAVALLSLLLLLLHLLPMPPQMWSALPGRDLVSEIDRVAGLDQVWRPFSLAPETTLNALFAALVPCAALVLGVQLEARERSLLIWPVLLSGGLSALLGLAQLAGPDSGMLYFYKITNDGAAVGLFANRNHQALLLATLLPVLAVWAAGRGPESDRSPVRGLLALLTGGAVLVLILVTGSRAGLVLAACALVCLPFALARSPMRLFRSGYTAQPRARRFALLEFLCLAGVIVSLLALTIWRGRGLAYERLLDTTLGDDLRFVIVPAIIAMIRYYLPFGSGLGTFERVFQVHEPDGLLRPNYANHAHNDWLELALTGGIPALLLLFTAIFAYVIRGRVLFAAGFVPTARLRFARLGMVMIALAAVASLGDYPLRVPSLACLFVIGVLWMSCPFAKNPPSGEPS